MATQKSSKFTSWELTEEELKSAELNSMQICAIENERCIIAESILALRVESGDVVQYKERLIYMQGQLGFADFILQNLSQPPQIPIGE